VVACRRFVVAGRGETPTRRTGRSAKVRRMG
jgi:hypothetical protein